MQGLLLYIDPGSGSFLLQFLIGAFLGISFFFKTIRMKIMSFFGRGKAGEKPGDESHES